MLNLKIQKMKKIFTHLIVTLLITEGIISTETRAYKASYTDLTSEDPTTPRYMRLMAAFYSNKFTTEEEIGKIQLGFWAYDKNTTFSRGLHA